MLAPFEAIAYEYIAGRTIIKNFPRIKDLKELKSLIKVISKPESKININALKKIEKVVEKFGGKVRYDLEPVKGAQNWGPHVQVEGFGTKIGSRYIQLTEEAVKTLKNAK